MIYRKEQNMKIENQAMMFALLCKYTVLAKGEEGREIIQKGMKRYGRERGARMAARAGNNGDPVCLWTNQAYGEWKPDYPGQMEFGTERTEPTLVTYISKCAWCEAWKKYDILEYGREYCVNVDAAVYEGFGGGFGCGARPVDYRNRNWLKRPMFRCGKSSCLNNARGISTKQLPKRCSESVKPSAAEWKISWSTIDSFERGLLRPDRSNHLCGYFIPQLHALPVRQVSAFYSKDYRKKFCKISTHLLTVLTTVL